MEARDYSDGEGEGDNEYSGGGYSSTAVAKLRPAEMDSLKPVIERMTHDNDELERAVSEARGELQQMQQDLAREESRIEEMKAEMEYLDSEECPVCNAAVQRDEIDAHMEGCLHDLTEHIASDVREAHAQQLDRSREELAKDARRLRMRSPLGAPAVEAFARSKSPTHAARLSPPRRMEAPAPAAMPAAMPMPAAGGDSLVAWLDGHGVGANCASALMAEGYETADDLLLLGVEDLRELGLAHRDRKALQRALESERGLGRMGVEEVSEVRMTAGRSPGRYGGGGGGRLTPERSSGSSGGSSRRRESVRRGRASPRDGDASRPSDEHHVWWVSGQGETKATLVLIGKGLLLLNATGSSQAAPTPPPPTAVEIGRWRYERIREWSATSDLLTITVAPKTAAEPDTFVIRSPEAELIGKLMAARIQVLIDQKRGQRTRRTPAGATGSSSEGVQSDVEGVAMRTPIRDRLIPRAASAPRAPPPPLDRTLRLAATRMPTPVLEPEPEKMGWRTPEPEPEPEPVPEQQYDVEQQSNEIQETAHESSEAEAEEVAARSENGSEEAPTSSSISDDGDLNPLAESESDDAGDGNPLAETSSSEQQEDSEDEERSDAGLALSDSAEDEESEDSDGGGGGEDAQLVAQRAEPDRWAAQHAEAEAAATREAQEASAARARAEWEEQEEARQAEHARAQAEAWAQQAEVTRRRQEADMREAERRLAEQKALGDARAIAEAEEGLRRERAEAELAQAREVEERERVEEARKVAERERAEAEAARLRVEKEQQEAAAAVAAAAAAERSANEAEAKAAAAKKKVEEEQAAKEAKEAETKVTAEEAKAEAEAAAAEAAETAAAASDMAAKMREMKAKKAAAKAEEAAAAAKAEKKAEMQLKMKEKLALAELMGASGEAVVGSDVWRRFNSDTGDPTVCKHNETGEVWQEFDNDGSVYYFNEDTQVTVWHLPGMDPEAAAEREPSVQPGGLTINIEPEEGAGEPLLSPIATPREASGHAGPLQVPSAKQVDFPADQPQPKLADFEVGVVLGRGSFGCVKHARHKTTNKCYALKRLPKRVVAARDAATANGALPAFTKTMLVEEKRVMQNMHSPFLTNLHGTFQDSENLYFVLEYVSGGEFKAKTQQGSGIPIKVNAHKTEQGPSGFSNEARFYHAELVLAMEYLHGRGVAFRDLKPENVLVDATGHLKLADFGCAKHLGAGGRTHTVCGTPFYMAPEVIQNQGHGVEVDVWALGVCLYQILERKAPFVPAGKNKDNTEKIFAKILKGKPVFSKPGSGVTVVPKETQDYICGLLEKAPAGRLGCGAEGVGALKAQSFYDGLDWEALQKRRGVCPEGRLPTVMDGDNDVSNYTEVKYEPFSSEKRDHNARRLEFESALAEGAEQQASAAGGDSWQAEEFGHAKSLFAYGDYIRAVESLELATGKVERKGLEGGKLVDLSSFKSTFDGF